MVVIQLLSLCVDSAYNCYVDLNGTCSLCKWPVHGQCLCQATVNYIYPWKMQEESVPVCPGGFCLFYKWHVLNNMSNLLFHL